LAALASWGGSGLSATVTTSHTEAVAPAVTDKNGVTTQKLQTTTVTVSADEKDPNKGTRITQTSTYTATVTKDISKNGTITGHITNATTTVTMEGLRFNGPMSQPTVTSSQSATASGITRMNYNNAFNEREYNATWAVSLHERAKWFAVGAGGALAVAAAPPIAALATPAAAWGSWILGGADWSYGVYELLHDGK